MKHVDQQTDVHFKLFASSLHEARARYGQADDKTFLERQKDQVDTLVRLESEFKQALIASPHGERVYKRFIKHICEERRNILHARPFFRERQIIFATKISKVLRARSVEDMYQFNFNFRFVQFVMKIVKPKPNGKLGKLYTQIVDVRSELVTMNMPLAISRARIFYSRTPKAHLTYMDFIQIAAEGLMSGIDKFVPPFSKAFRSCAMGRMTGNFIENYSETLVHFFPIDKRKIYRANKLVGRQPSKVDYDNLAQNVNQGVLPRHCTNASEISDLMAAASTVSADIPINDNDEEVLKIVDRCSASSDTQPDVICEKMNSLKALDRAMDGISPFESKILKLKGISL